MTEEAAKPSRRKALVVCTHLRPGRTKRSSRHFLQPLTGLHIASLIDQSHFDVELYHEDWHGPYDTRLPRRYDLVFLTGLQADFDRMRQLSFHFRRQGAAVIAGGSICTLFPDFAARFFDAVCAGGVDAVPDAVSDYLNGRLKTVYVWPASRITRYELDYSLLTRAGISLPALLIEASRGCSFRCSFCVLPAEGAAHASYALETVRRAIDNAIAASPRFSFRRRFPMIFFYDNNFSDNREQMLQVARMLRDHPRIRAWAALVTQNVLQDRALVDELSRLKCRALFIGLESLDPAFLKRFNKTQNLSRKGSIVSDILYAERRGIFISYGCLFDPRLQTVAAFRAQIDAMLDVRGFPAPTFYSLVSPLAGTEAFWSDMEQGELLPNLALRDLEGETIAYRRLKDAREAVSELAGHMSLNPARMASWGKMLRSNLWRILRCGRLDPIHWYTLASTHLHSYWVARHAATRRSTYLPGEVLDPQYSEFPADITPEERRRYFEPIMITTPEGEMADWLRPYHAERAKRSKKRITKAISVTALHVGPSSPP